MNEDKSVRYHRQHGRARVAALVVSGAALGAVYLTGVSGSLAALAVRLAGPAQDPPAQFLQGGFIALFLGLASFPLARYVGFSLERRYGLSRESAAAWLRGHVKAGMPGLLAVAGLSVLVYQTLPRWPHAWWVIAGLGVAAGLILFAVVAPFVFVPLVLHTRVLERPGLTDRLTALAGRAGLPVAGVYEWTLGERSSRANAALVGLGRLRRVIVSDTLLHACTDEEVEVILAHELGHVRHRDILSGMALEIAVVTAGLGLAALVLGLGWRELGLSAPADLAGLPLVILSVGAASTLARPWLNAESRRRERRADRFALELTGRHDAFISAMRKIGAANLADPDPSPVHVLLFHTHPTLGARIDAARQHATASTAPRPAPAAVSGR